MSNKKIKFDHVEFVRKSLGFTVTDMTTLLCVSRGTYYKWRNGHSMSDPSNFAVRKALRIMLDIMNRGDLHPASKDARRNTCSKRRLDTVMELMERLEHP